MPKVKSINSNRFCHQTGFGFDSHLFDTKGTLVLGGLLFKGIPALAGHSDGDALLHAVIDALLGGSGQGDIGELFPDTSHKWKGTSSQKMLRQVVRKLNRNKIEIAHVDVTVLTNRPKLKPVKEKMKMNLSKIMGISKEQLNIKAKTQEGLILFEHPGGIAVWAVATLSKIVKSS